MKAKFKITNPDKAECTLQITMTLGAWKILKDQLDSKNPSWELQKVIIELVDKAREEFESDGEFES